MIGVYRIRNKNTRTVYIGSSCRSIARRFTEHKTSLRKGVQEIQKLRSPTKLKNSVEKAEQIWIDKYPISKMYNICFVAGSRFGTKMSEEAKKAIGDAFRGRPISEEQKARLRIVNRGQGLGRKLSKATRLKMSAYRRDRKLSVEHRKAISKGRKGMKFSSEHKASLSAAQLRRFKNPKERARCSATAKSQIRGWHGYFVKRKK